jgi:uncharacterized protein (TIGR03435 family)
MRRVFRTLVWAMAGIAAASASAQSISYVASVKPNNAADPRGFTEYQPGGRFTATAATVRTLLRLAYRVQDYQLVGAPAWFSTKRFDIAAKVEDNPPPSLQIFLQTLLKDRFGLVIHNEIRDLPTFALVLAKSDGKLGPQLIHSAFDCAAYMAAPHGPPEPGRTPNCATRINAGSLSGRSITMTQLATSLAPFVNRFTVDKTGLTGGFDVELTWTADDSSDPGIFTTIQEQLGLKLVPEKGPVNVAVVDRAAEPSEN